MKKKIYTLLLMLGSFSLSMFSCQEQPKVSETVVKDEASGFTLITDTVTLDTKLLGIQLLDEKDGYELYSLVKYRGQYELLFFNHSTDSIIISSLSADFRYKSILKAAMPDSYPSSHLFFVRNDSLLLRIKNKVCQYIYFNCDSLTSQVIQLPTRLSNKDKYYHVECYQDEDYVIDYLDDGEFGQFVTFFDRYSDNSHSFAIPMNHVRRWHGAYYLIAPFNIIRIDNPLAERETFLQDHRPAMSFSTVDDIENLSLEPRYDRWYVDYWWGEDIFPKTYNSAFVHQDQLYVLENRRPEGLFLMKFLEPDSLQEVLQLTQKPFDDYSLRSLDYEIMTPPDYTLRFTELEDDLLHFIELDGNIIRKVFLKLE